MRRRTSVFGKVSLDTAQEVWPPPSFRVAEGEPGIQNRRGCYVEQT